MFKKVCYLPKSNFKILSKYFSGHKLTEAQRIAIKNDHQEIYDFQKRAIDLQTLPPDKEEPFTFYSILSKYSIFKSRGFFNFISKNFDNNQIAEYKSDFYNPPKIHDNSIFIFQSRLLANRIRSLRSFDTFFMITIFGIFKYPLEGLVMAGVAYAIGFNALYFELSRRLVARMDLLPHLEMVHVQRIGSFGQIYSKLYRTKDLEYVNYKKLEEKENYFWPMSGHKTDEYLIFKCKQTGDLLLFDKNGYWNQAGLEHELIN